MRLMNTSASVAYVHPSEREPDLIPNTDEATKAKTPMVANPNAGKPKDGATVWMLRAMTSREDGALQDSIYDLSRTSAAQDKSGDMRVNMNMAISPSTLRRNRVRLGIVGWENLLDHEGNPIPFTQVDFALGNKTFKAVPEDVLDMMPQSLINALAAEVEKNSSVSFVEGNG